MVKAPPTRVSLQGSHRLQLVAQFNGLCRVISAEDPAGKDGCNLRNRCDEFRLATAFGWIAAGAWNKFTGFSSSFHTVFHEPRRLGASGTLYCSKEQQ
jgi:hypothetical protein